MEKNTIVFMYKANGKEERLWRKRYIVMNLNIFVPKRSLPASRGGFPVLCAMMCMRTLTGNIGFRIRIYNNSDDLIELENKKKVCGMTSKDACRIDRELCEKLLSGEAGVLDAGEQPVWNKFALGWNTRQFRAKVIVDYERTVFVCPLGNVRVTFDRNIASSADYTHFFDQTIKKRPVMPTGIHVLEVKYDEFLPDYIYKSIEIENLQRTAFSKYYLCRKYHL